MHSSIRSTTEVGAAPRSAPGDEIVSGPKLRFKVRLVSFTTCASSPTPASCTKCFEFAVGRSISRVRPRRMISRNARDRWPAGQVRWRRRSSCPSHQAKGGIGAGDAVNDSWIVRRRPRRRSGQTLPRPPSARDAPRPPSPRRVEEGVATHRAQFFIPTTCALASCPPGLDEQVLGKDLLVRPFIFSQSRLA